MKKITSVILAAGKSSRFKATKSKIFQDLAGTSIIEHVYKLAEKISGNDIIFVCNNDNIVDLRKIFSKAKFVVQKNQSGTADAILCAKKYILNKNILILFGDVPLITSKSIKKLIINFDKNKSIGSMIAFKSNLPFGYGRVKIKNKFIESIVEETNATESERKINLCNSGVMICNSKLLFQHVAKISNRNIKKEKFLPDIFNIFYFNNIGFSYVICPEEEMLGINTINDFIRLDNIYQKKLADKIISNGVIIKQPNTVRLSFDSRIQKGVIIEPFVHIKKGVLIKKNALILSHSILEGCVIDVNSKIGPSARIRPGSKIGQNVKIGNYVEIKNSIIGNDTSISHLSYIGDSILGKNINIGAGTITCNYDGKKKSQTIIKDNVFIGSNCSLIAPIKIGHNSTIGAGSVVSKDIPSNHLALERAEIKILRKLNKK